MTNSKMTLTLTLVRNAAMGCSCAAADQAWSSKASSVSVPSCSSCSARTSKGQEMALSQPTPDSKSHDPAQTYQLQLCLHPIQTCRVDNKHAVSLLLNLRKSRVSARYDCDYATEYVLWAVKKHQALHQGLILHNLHVPTVPAASHLGTTWLKPLFQTYIY